MDLSAGFSHGQQASLIGHCLINEEFFLRCKGAIKPGWLTADIYIAHIFQELIKFYESYKMMPTSASELLDEPFFRSQQPADYEKYKNTIVLCMQQQQSYSLDVLRPKLTDYVKTVTLKEHTKILVNDITKNNYDKAVKETQSIQSKLSGIDFEANPYVDFSDTVSLWTRKENSEGNFMSSGSKLLDEMLGPGVIKRGGNLGIIAPTFTGKSRFLITMARHALVQGKKVLYIIHEDDTDNVKKRMIASICGMGVKELSIILQGGYTNQVDVPWPVDSWGESDRALLYNVTVQELEKAKDLLMKNLIFLSWQKAGKMFVEDVADEIRRIELEQKQKTGSGFDVMFNDYPKHLYSKTKTDSERARLEYVYQYLNTLGSELKIFTVYAIQANRSAAKLMKNGEAEQAIGLEDVGESYGIAQNASASISLNRSKEDGDHQILRISIPKARESGMNNMMITKSAYNECVLYGDPCMFTEFGRFMIKGLPAVKSPEGQFISSTSTAVASLQSAELTLNQTGQVIQSKMPDIIKKIKKINHI